MIGITTVAVLQQQNARLQAALNKVMIDFTKAHYVGWTQALETAAAEMEVRSMTPNDVRAIDYIKPEVEL